MWWENLSYLDELCRAGSMTAAARSLRVDKATVSRRIAELERNAPAALFERRCGVFELTPYGARAIEAFRDHERSRRRLAEELDAPGLEARGSVRVTAPTFFGRELIVPALPSFLRSHRQITVQIHGSNRLLDLARAEADIAIRNIRPTHGELEVRKVGTVGMAAYASTNYLAERGGLRAPFQLCGHDFISCEGGPYAGPGFEWLPEAAARATLAFSANDALSLRDAACAGLGIAVLPQILGDAAPELTRVAGAGEGAVDLWLVTRQEQRSVPRVRAVVQFLAELVRSHQRRLHAPAPAAGQAPARDANDVTETG
jgi:DNA-binding transcriptional LysR family regulator